MNHFMTKYRNWLMETPEQTGDIISCAGYLILMLSFFGAATAFSGGTYLPMALSLVPAVAVFVLIHIP
jgi:hypothetical protein